MDYLDAIFKFFELGGLVMWAIAILAFFSYFFAFYTLFSLFGYLKLCMTKKNFFADYFVAFSETDDVEAIKQNFVKIRSKIFDRVDGRLKYSLALAGVAPLLGLLGTISGLGYSFSGLLNSTSAVSEGVSQALYTTEAGLSVALPVFIVVLLAKSFKQRILINISKYEICLLREACL